MSKELRRKTPTIPSPPNVRTVSDRIRHQSGTKVSGEIDRVSRLPTETGPYAKYDEEQSQRRELACADIVIILGHVREGQEQAAD